MNRKWNKAQRACGKYGDVGDTTRKQTAAWSSTEMGVTVHVVEEGRALRTDEGDLDEVVRDLAEAKNGEGATEGVRPVG